MSRTLEQLMAQASQIKEATIQGENTALRVGGLFVDMVDYLSTIHGSDVTLSPLLNALNDWSLINPRDNEILSYNILTDKWEFSSAVTQLSLALQQVTQQVTTNYDEYLNAIDTIERELHNVDTKFLPLTGGTLTGLLVAAAGIKVLGSLQIGNYFSSGLLGSGGIFREEANGTTYLEADKLYIRMKAYFDTVEIRRYIHSGGNRIASVAGIKCARVVPYDENGEVVLSSSTPIAFYRCFFRGTDDEITVTNDFEIGDQAYCHITNVTSTDSMYMHHFWRLVIGKSDEPNSDDEHYIDLSNRTTETIDNITYAGYQEDSDAPSVEDDIIQLGNVNDSDRRGAIIEYVSGADAPSYKIYQDLGNPGTASTIVQKRANQFSMLNKEFISLGYNSATGRAYLNAFGDLHFGDRNDSTYIKYTPEDPTTHLPKLDIKANVIFQSPETQQDITLDQFAGLVVGDIENLQSQIDGEITTWFYDYMPVAESQGAPANRVPLITRTIEGQQVPVEPYYTWYNADDGGTAQEVTTERTKHLGDNFYDNSSGYAFRFSLNETTQAFEWVEIQDSAVIEALSKAAEAQDTADHKRRVFVAQPAPISPKTYVEYDVGDLWTMVTYPANNLITDESQHIYYRELLKCKRAKPIRNSQGVVTNGNFEIEDWELATKYTDDSYAHGFDYIKTAMKGDTKVHGGLLLTNTILLRDLDTTVIPAEPTNVMSGINGLVDPDAGLASIAGWYGGDMVDVENLSYYWDATQIAAWNAMTPAQKASSVLVAHSLFRFDGSGYLAGGNISWTDTGTLTVQGSIVSASNYINTPSIYLNGRDVTSILDAFEIETDNNNVTWVHVKHGYSFYSDGDISALGASSGGGGGGGGASVLYELNDVTPNATHDGVYGAQNGYVLTYDASTTHWYAAPAAQTYVLPQATSGALGGIKIGFTTDTTNKNYAVALDNDGKAYVNVPWSGGTQSDWNESDSSSLAYIKNKPTIPTVPTNVSAFTNDSGYITSSGSCNYATSAGSTNKLTALETITYGANYLQFKDFFAQTSGNSPTEISNPTGDWYHHIVMNHGNSAGYFVDMAICFHDDYFYYRRIAGGNANSWVRVIDSSNIGSQSVSYATTSGTATYANSAGSATSAGYATSAGSATDSTKLPLAGGAMNSGARISFSGGNLYLGNSGNEGWLMVQDICSQDEQGDGKWSLRTNGNAHVVYLYASSDVQVTSDERRKDVIGNVQLSVEQIAQMPSVLFRWKKGFGDDLIHVGTIAQSWEKVLPAAVGIGTDDDRTRSFSYSAAAYAMAHADACEIVALKKRVSELEAELKRYKSA